MLRPAKDEDWEGRARSFELTVTMMQRLYHEAELVLVDGTKIPVNPGGMEMVQDASGRMFFFDRLINTYVNNHPEWEGKPLEIRTKLKFFYDPDDGQSPVEVAAFRCRTELVEGMSQTMIHTAPEDWVFVQHLPSGEVADEKSFFQFVELQRVAEEFKAQRVQCP